MNEIERTVQRKSTELGNFQLPKDKEEFSKRISYELSLQEQMLRGLMELGVFDATDETIQSRIRVRLLRALGHVNTYSPLENYRFARNQLLNNLNDPIRVEEKLKLFSVAFGKLVAYTKNRVQKQRVNNQKYGEYTKASDEEYYASMLESLSDRFRTFTVKDQRSAEASKVSGGGSYWINVDGQTVNQTQMPRKLSSLRRIDRDLPYEGRAEHVDYAIVRPEGARNNPSEILIIAGLHADERGSGKIWRAETRKGLGVVARIEALNVITRAIRRREIIEPLTEAQLKAATPQDAASMAIMLNGRGVDELMSNYFSSPTEKTALGETFKLIEEDAAFEKIYGLQNSLRMIAMWAQSDEPRARAEFERIKPQLLDLIEGKRFEGFKNIWSLGRKIDPNRAFHIPESAKTWEDVMASVNLPEAKMLLQLLRDNPDNRFIFAIHEDPELTDGTGKGVYFYDAVFDARTDTQKELILKLRDRLTMTLTAHDFEMADGVTDNQNDAYLGYQSDKGYIYQPIIAANGKRSEVRAFEDAAVVLGSMGLTKTERAFSFEIPGGLSPDRKALLLAIIRDEFIRPFVASQGIIEEEQETKTTHSP